MSFPTHRRFQLSWLIAASCVVLMLIIGAFALNASAEPLVADLSTSTLTVDQSTAKAGGDLDYTLSIINSGTDSASNIVVTNTLPTGATYAGTISDFSGNGYFLEVESVSGAVLVLKGFVGSGRTAAIEFSSSVPDGAATDSVLTNMAEIAHESGSKSVSASTTVVEAAPNMSTSTKEANRDIAKTGDVIQYTITLANTGDDAGTVEMTDALPSELTYVANSLTWTDLDNVTYLNNSVSGNVVEWSGFFGVGSSATVKFNATVNDGVADLTNIVNTVEIEDANTTVQKMASTQVVSETETLIYLPIIFRSYDTPTLSIGSVSEEDGDATWTVSWNSVASGVQYELQEATDADFTSDVTSYTTSNTSQTIEKVSNSGLTYYYRVRVSTGVGSGYSNAESVTLESRLELDRTSLSAGARDCTLLRWDFENIKEFRMNFAEGFSKAGEAGTNTRRVCPSVDTTYEAEVTLSDGSVIYPSITANVDNSDGKCNRDPYIVEWAPEDLDQIDDFTYEVEEDTRITINWDVNCAGAIFIRYGEGAEEASSDEGSDTFKVTGDTTFYIRVKSSTAQGDFEETSAFTVQTTR